MECTDFKKDTTRPFESQKTDRSLEISCSSARQTEPMTSTLVNNEGARFSDLNAGASCFAPVDQSAERRGEAGGVAWKAIMSERVACARSWCEIIECAHDGELRRARVLVLAVQPNSFRIRTFLAQLRANSAATRSPFSAPPVGAAGLRVCARAQGDQG